VLSSKQSSPLKKEETMTKIIAALSMVLLMLAVACSSEEPATPVVDMDATVEARVAAAIEARDAATPTTTPTSMPKAQTILDQSKIVMFNSESFRSDETWRVESPNLKMVSIVSSKYQAPDKWQGTMEYANEIMNQIQISDQCYEEKHWFGKTEWIVADCEKEFDNGFSPEKITVLDLDIESHPVIKDYEGSAVYYINSGELEDFSLMRQTIWYETFFSDEDPTIQNQPTTYKVEYWIDRDSHALREIRFVYYIDSIGNPDSPFGKVGEPLEVEITAIFSSVNDVKEPIVAPPVHSDDPVATPAPTATPDLATDFYSINNSDLAASSTPNTICDRNSINYGHSWTPLLYDTNPLEMRAGETYQTIGYGSLPNQLCVHYYSFQAVIGVNYSISVDVNSEDLMRDSLIYLYDQNYNLREFNLYSISFTAEYDGTYYFLVGEMGENIIHEAQITDPPLHYRVQVSKESSEATPQPIATPDPAASNAPHTICDNEKSRGNGYMFSGLIDVKPLSIPIGLMTRVENEMFTLPNSTCVNKYSFEAEQGVSYAISVYIHSEGLTMTDSFIDLYDRDYQLIAVNDDYAKGSLGSRISFTAEYDGPYHFLVGEMDDNNASNLTYEFQVFRESKGTHEGSVFGKKLVFISDQKGTPELFLAAYSGIYEKFDDLMKLTDNGYATDDPRFGYESKEAYLELQPVFSPNGLGIAYVSNANGNNDIYVTFARGPDLGVLTSVYTTDPGNDTHPSWHPSGEYLAFDTNRNGKAEIYTVDVKHGLTEPLIQMSERHAYDPEYSPDGKLVAFNLVSDDGLTDIYIHNITTGENTNITNTDMTSVGQHDWSSDGSKLIFRADPDATDTYYPSQLEIFTINKDGSNLVQITNNEKLDASPKWSEDGTSIYFVSLENQEQPKIYVMDADGSNERRVTTLSSSVQEIYFDIYE
jgi:Tol biopolymer transport system component